MNPVIRTRVAYYYPRRRKSGRTGSRDLRKKSEIFRDQLQRVLQMRTQKAESVKNKSAVRFSGETSCVRGLRVAVYRRLNCDLFDFIRPMRPIRPIHFVFRNKVDL